MTELLFSKRDLAGALTNHENDLKKEILGLSEDRILTTSLDDLLDYFCEKYEVDMPKLNEEGTYTDHGDTVIDVSRRFDYGSSRFGGPQQAHGTRYEIHVPFDGDADLFRWQPSRYDFSPPRARIRNDRLVFEYDALPSDTSALQSQIKSDLSKLRRNLGWVEEQIKQFNSRVRQIAKGAIEARRGSLMRAQETALSLGFPVKRRADAPNTYSAPEVRRKIAPKLPPMTPGRGALEPVLDAAEYEHILGVMSNMVTVMERSPSAFREMQEEDLRQHLLVQLNAQYEGQATAETFNANGKTDILIRVEGKNIFIAECKFWNGPTHLAKALDQLLSYTTWRDTKTALLVFNRNVQMSTVLDRIPEVVEQHPNHKATLNYDSETGFRYTLTHKDDPERDLTLTVLVFDVPAGD